MVVHREQLLNLMWMKSSCLTAHSKRPGIQGDNMHLMWILIGSGSDRSYKKTPVYLLLMDNTLLSSQLGYFDYNTAVFHIIYEHINTRLKSHFKCQELSFNSILEFFAAVLAENVF